MRFKLPLIIIVLSFFLQNLGYIYLIFRYTFRDEISDACAACDNSLEEKSAAEDSDHTCS